MLKEVHSGECGGMIREKEVIPMHLTDGLLLAHYEEGCSRICEKVSRLPGASQFDPYKRIELVNHDYAMALSHMGAQFGGTSQPTFERVYLDLKSYRVFYQMGRGHTTA